MGKLGAGTGVLAYFFLFGIFCKLLKREAKKKKEKKSQKKNSQKIHSDYSSPQVLYIFFSLTIIKASDIPFFHFLFFSFFFLYFFLFLPSFHSPFLSFSLSVSLSCCFAVFSKCPTLLLYHHNHLRRLHHRLRKPLQVLWCSTRSDQHRLLFRHANAPKYPGPVMNVEGKK